MGVDVCDLCFFFSSRRRHTRFDCDWSSDVCSSDLADTIAVRLPTRYRFGRVKFGVVFSRQTEMRLDARFGKENARARFPDRDHFVGWLERRETATHLSRRENFVAEAMFLGTPLRAGHDCAVRPADHQTAGLSHHETPGPLFQFSPQPVIR